MKNTIIIICSIILGAFALLLVMLMGGKINRKMELKNDLPIVVEQAVDNLLLTKHYGIAGRNEFLSDVVSELSCLLDNDCDIMIKVTGADTEKGLLSVRITAGYTQPDGTEKEIVCDKTVILNKSASDG